MANINENDGLGNLKTMKPCMTGVTELKRDPDKHLLAVETVKQKDNIGVIIYGMHKEQRSVGDLTQTQNLQKSVRFSLF